MEIDSVGFKPVNVFTSGTYPTEKGNYDEVPVRKDGEYYYAGAQLRGAITGYTYYNRVTSNGDYFTLGEGNYVGVGTPNYSYLLNESDPASTGAVIFTSNSHVVISSGCAVKIHVTVEFPETDTDQTVYRGFGDGGDSGFFSRTFLVTFAAVQNSD